LANDERQIPICAVIHRCSMGVMTVCPAFKASRPCWEVEGTCCASEHRDELCSDCKVYKLFIKKEKCWEVRGCEERFRLDCPAYLQKKNCFELMEDCPLRHPKRAIVCNHCEVCQHHRYESERRAKKWMK